jgi:hypothetical protein
MKIMKTIAGENYEQGKSILSTREIVQSAMKRCDVRVKNEDFSKYWPKEDNERGNNMQAKPSIIQFSKFSKAKTKLKQNQKLYSDDFAEECKTKCAMCNKVLKLSYLNAHVRNVHEIEVDKYYKLYMEIQKL